MPAYYFNPIGILLKGKQYRKLPKELKPEYSYLGYYSDYTTLEETHEEYEDYTVCIRVVDKLNRRSPKVIAEKTWELSELIHARESYDNRDTEAQEAAYAKQKAKEDKAVAKFFTTTQ